MLQKRFGAGVEINPVLRTRETVPFIRVKDVGHFAAVLPDGLDDLFGFSLFDTRIVGALANQQRPDDFVRLEQR